MKDIKTAYSLGSEGMLITSYTEDASYHEVETKDYHEVIKDMEAGAYDADLNMAMQIADIVMVASMRDYVVLDAEEKTVIARYVFCLTFVKRMEEEYGRVPVRKKLTRWHSEALLSSRLMKKVWLVLLCIICAA